MPLLGAGAFGAGLGSGGFDPVTDPSPSTVSTAPAALFFDPTTRDFRLNADGRFVAVDPVDQEVVIALWVKFRTIGSAPDAGSRLREIDRQGGPGFVGKVQDVVRLALKDLLGRGAIEIIDIQIFTPARGRTYVLVNYVNKTTLQTQKSSIPLLTG